MESKLKMPTFGSEQVGASYTSLTNCVRGSIFDCPEKAFARFISAHLSSLRQGSAYRYALYRASDRTLIKQTEEFAKKGSLALELVAAEVVDVKEIGTGARACIDTCELMKPGEGMLLGCQSSGLFLVQAEVHESPYVETRPFRVNAGPLSLHALTSPTRTRYLSELKAGEEVLVVDREGKVRLTNVARAKIEWRPMLLIEADYSGKTLKLIAQNAETIRVVTPEGSKAVTDLKKGDKILARVEEGGRHFGTLVKEEAVIER